MGQTSFNDDGLKLTFTVIDETNHYVEVKKKQNDFNNSNVKSLNIPATVTHNSITYTVTKIADYGFQQSNSLKTLTIPNTVTSIGKNAFQGCGALELVDMPSTVSTIGSAAFQECHKLHSLQLPSSLTEISADLFHSCHNLNEIIIPEGIVSISARAFQNTHDVKIIFLGCGNANHEIIINSTAFTNCYNDDIEILCLNGVLNFKDQNGQPINFGNNTLFQVPCGMSAGYTGTYTNVTVTEENCISISRRSGPFCLPETWEGYESWSDRVAYEAAGSTYEAKEAWLKNGDDNPNNDRYPTFVPRKPEHPFYIQEGDTVVLNHSRHIYPFNSINKGVLKVNTQEGGQLIERDSLFFDEHYTIHDVKYQIYTEVIGDDTKIFITRNGHEATEITDIFNSNTVDGTTYGDYRKEGTAIRDMKTRYIFDVTESNGAYSASSPKDMDFYDVKFVEGNPVLCYYENYPTVYSISVSSLNGDPNAAGFWKVNDNGNTFYKHNKTFNEQTTTVTINTGGDVTLHGTDYVYGHVKMHENLGGEIEIVVPATKNLWNFVGAPFNGYDLWSVKIGPGGSDVTIVEFDYANKQWSESFSTVDDEINPGEGFLAWPFYDGGIIFSTKRDYGTTSQVIGTKIMEEDFALNNDTVIVEKTVRGTNEDGRWLALANPYPAKLCVNSFVEDNTPKLQGQGVYVLTNEVVDNKQKFEFKPRTDVEANKYDLGVGQGFFVNVVESSNPTKITFTKSQLHEYDESTCGHEEHSQAKSATIKEFVKIVMIEDGVETELLFAQNPDSEQEYDIYDANKLFSMSEISEPYFVTDGIALVKEEVKDLPYYATMNVKSFGEKEVSFKANYIPQGLTVSIIDGEEIISLNNGEIYTTNIVAGENSDRFKILFGSTVGLAETENTTSNIQITNNDRAVNIATTEKDLHIEVYNALGQKVYETQNHNFILNNLSAGAYMIKAYNKTTSQTTKVIIK